MWYYLVEGRQEGPIDEARLETLVSGGIVTAETKVWKEGQAEWIPLGSLREATRLSLPVAAGPEGTCQLCRQPVGAQNLIELAGVKVCAACKPLAVQKLQEGVALDGDTVWHEGKSVVSRDGTKFPPRCYKCNAPAAPAPLKVKLYWHNPFFYLLVLLNLFIYVLVAVFVRKRATMEVFLCPQHWQRRRSCIIAAWALSVVGFGVFLGGIAMNVSWLIIIGVIMIPVGLLVGMMGARVVTTRQIKNKIVWMRGAGKDFLAELPPWQGT